jgi:hypothetical protein
MFWTRKRTRLEQELHDLRPVPDDDFLKAKVQQMRAPARRGTMVGRVSFAALLVGMTAALGVVFATGSHAGPQVPASLRGIVAADATETNPPTISSCVEPGNSGDYTVIGTYPDSNQTVTVELRSGTSIIASTTFAANTSHAFTWAVNTTQGSGVTAVVIQGQVVSAAAVCGKK